MKFHPLAELFPILPEHELKELADDIKQNGLRARITLYEEKILDGRNRWLACKRANVQPKFREHTGGDALGFVISANLLRRHLTTSQRSMIATKLATMREGRPSKTSSNDPVSVQHAADSLRISPASVKRAKKVLRESPEDAEAVQRGEKSLSEAAKQKTRNEALVDKTGYPIPEKAKIYWDRTPEVREVLDHISKAKSAVQALQDTHDLLYAECNINGIYSYLINAYNEFKQAFPYAVCPVCQGQTPKTCVLCKGRGMISKFLFKTAVPEELKAIRAEAAGGGG